MRKTKIVHYNDLALIRINQARERRGQPPIGERDIQVVMPGDEVVGATDTGTAPSAETAAVGAPTSVDNSTLKYFPPIRSQGSLNSCAQFSAVYYTLTHMNALARDWDSKAGGDTLRFSPKWTYNMVNGGANVGSWHYDAYAIAQKHGTATWAEFPYDGDYKGWSLNPTTWRNAINFRANTTGKVLDVDTAAGLDQLKQLLLNGYVLNYATYINSWVWGTITNDPGTAADDSLAGKKVVLSVNGTNGGHAMTIVGYNDDIWVDLNSNGVVESNEKGALRIANSWGTGWNEAGYAWISYQALRTRNPASTSEGIFWYDEATWVTARSSYAPRLLAEFSMSHVSRSDLAMTLGTGASGAASPSTTWNPNRLLTYAGGPYAFNGGTTELSGTFYLDFSDLIPVSGGGFRYFLGARDSTSGNSLTLQSFNLIDLVHSKTLSFASVPQAVDAGQQFAGIDYDFSSGTVPPVAIISASGTGGALPYTVSFDGSASQDTEGSLINFSWDFGDGASALGATTQHVYTRAGTFTARLTVTSSTGAQASAQKSISVFDPNVVNAPSALSASVSGTTVTLQWTDNAQNETGFVIERAAKIKSGLGSYSVVGTTGANITKFSHTASSGTYYYRVKAQNSTTGTSSSYSTAISVRVR